VRGVIGGYISCEFHQGTNPLVGHLVNDDTPLPLRRDVSAPFQTRKMVTDSALRQPETRDNLAHGAWPFEQVAYNLQARWVAEPSHELREEFVTEVTFGQDFRGFA
jgi:hypothetical protein